MINISHLLTIKFYCNAPESKRSSGLKSELHGGKFFCFHKICRYLGARERRLRDGWIVQYAFVCLVQRTCNLINLNTRLLPDSTEHFDIIYTAFLGCHIMQELQTVNNDPVFGPSCIKSATATTVFVVVHVVICTLNVSATCELIVHWLTLCSCIFYSHCIVRRRMSPYKGAL